MDLKPTAVELAKKELIELLRPDKMKSTELIDRLMTAGHSRWTALKARRQLENEGVVKTSRPGARSNPYIVELVG